MKILQVTHVFKPLWESGGMARAAYEISRGLVERGHELTVYTTNRSLYSTNLETNKPVCLDGMKVYYFENLRKYFPWRTLPPLPYYLPFIAKKEVRDFDVIHIHGHRTTLAVIVHHYAKKYNIPYVLQTHGSVLPFFQKQRLKKILDLFFGYKILKDASKIIASTKIEAEQYKKMGVDEGKIEIVPNGIDLSEYDNLSEKGKFRRKYSLRDEKIILYLGRIHKIKGIDLLMKAFAELIKKMDDVRLVIVGPDDGFLSTLKRQIEDLKIGDKILLTGLIPEKDKLEAYVDADVYVLPSVYETFPLTVLEACACGTPVIVTDRCGIANIVNDNNVGHVVEYNKDQLRDAIFKLLINEELRRYFGRGGKKLVREKFSWDIVVEQLEKIYGNIICN